MKRFEKYLQRENASIAHEHSAVIKKQKEISQADVLLRNEINQLFTQGYLNGENGFRRLDDGSTYVAVCTKMPGVTLQQIDWWFWWHAAE